MNYVELEKLRQRVLKFPEQYRQEFWGYGKNSRVVRTQKPACKTAGCLAYNVVAGHGYKLVFNDGCFDEADTCHKRNETVDIMLKAKEILELNSKQSSELFAANGGAWSRRAHAAYHNATNPEQRAAAAAMEIEDFVAKYRAIEAYGAELIRDVKDILDIKEAL